VADIKFDASGAVSSYLEYSLANLAAVYVKVEGLTISAATLAAWYAVHHFFTGDLIQLDDATGTRENTALTRDVSTTEYDAWTDSLAADIVLPPLADIPHVVELWRPAAGSGYFKVDGVSHTASGLSPSVGWQIFRLGYTFWDAPQLLDSFTCGKITIGTTDGGADVLVFDPATAPDLSPFTLTGSVTLEGAGPPPPGPSRRFFSGYPWRFIVTDLNTETITFLDRLATARQVTVGRNQARHAQGTVPSDSPEVNIPHTDGDPFLNEGNRLVYGFRREGWNGTVGPWVCRFAGPLLHLEDNAQTDAPASPWIAMDPWAILYRRPVRLEDGDLPGVDGRVFLAADLWTYPEIALQLLLDSITYDGTCFIDPTGGTVTPGGVISADVTLQQGLSVGAAWDQLCATGRVDIELDPVYDPVGSPGICAVLIAKPTIGVTQNAAIFAWDLPSRSLTDISRVTDGTGRANTIQYYFGQGGPPVSLQIDAASKAKYGEYWEQQFWPGFRQAGPVTAMAARRLALVKDGVRTFTFAPAPERSPVPFDDYMPGDWAPFFASKKLRAKLGPTLVSGQWTNIPRIESFTVDIADNQTETVNPLLVSMDIQP
jgi:hypothetical protein